MSFKLFQHLGEIDVPKPHANMVELIWCAANDSPRGLNNVGDLPYVVALVVVSY
jgi:hypothetical protein